MIRIERELGRIKLNMLSLSLGRSICIILTDGESAVRTVNIGSHTHETNLISMGSQEEYLLAANLSECLSEKYEGAFAICCGIHLDYFTEKETAILIELSREMIGELCLIFENFVKGVNS